ncbi:MAG: hypothetical protein E7447_05775 [Ruminococcaceae bacterium]|nr:hypothetical protein [Oscillospiraceae bacterium]
MAMETKVQYINAYVSGTCAPQPEKKTHYTTSAQLPQVKKQQKWLISFDLAAIGGILAAVVLSVLLIVSLVQMNQAREEARMYEEYVISLQEQNAQLQDTYTSGYDLEEVQSIAQAMGMVPADQVTHIQMQVNEPEIVEELTAWESFWAFLVGMFA